MQEGGNKMKKLTPKVRMCLCFLFYGIVTLGLVASEQSRKVLALVFIVAAVILWLSLVYKFLESLFKRFNKD